MGKNLRTIKTAPWENAIIFNQFQVIYSKVYFKANINGLMWKFWVMIKYKRDFQ